MPCNLAPSLMTQTRTVLDPKGEPIALQEWYLQYTFEKTENRVTEKKMETRSEQDKEGHTVKRECREIENGERWRQPWGHYCVVPFNAEKVCSGWWYVGLGAVILGLGAAAIVTGGLVVGAAWTGTVVAGTVATVSIGVAGIGATIMIGLPSGYEKGEQMGTPYETDEPRGPWEKYDTFTRVVKDWYPC